MRGLRLAAALGAVAFATAAYAEPPNLKVPAEVAAKTETWLVIEPETDAKAVVYLSLDGMTSFPREESKNPLKLVLFPTRPGRFRFVAVGTRNDEQTVTPFTVVVNGVAPTPPPPEPTPPPKPVDPAPIPVDGFRVLIVYETKDLSLYPAAQVAAIYSSKVRTYLNTHCAVGPNGTTREWRIWDKDVDASGAAKLWQDAMKRPRGALPSLLISNGKTGYEGTFTNEADLMSKLAKFGGN